MRKRNLCRNLSSVFSVLFVLLAVTGVLLAGGCQEHVQPDRGVLVSQKARPDPAVSLNPVELRYGDSRALVIGIDDYRNGWPRLSNAVRDARTPCERRGSPSK